MKNPVSRVWALMCVLSLTFPASVFATNGYFLIGFGAKSRAMGGTGIANPVDSLAAASNPAGMALVGTGIDLGAELFNPPREVAAANGEFGFQTPLRSAASPSNNKSGSNLFLIPSMGGNYKFNRKITIGMSAIGAGFNTRYTDNFFELTGVPPNQPYGTLGVNLLQMQMLPTVTYRVNANNFLGLSLAMGVQSFRAYGLGNFGTPGTSADFEFSSDDENLTNRGNDFAFGAGIRLGWLGRYFKKRVQVGSYYASRVYMTKFDKYKGLFAEQGSFDIPEHFGVGLALKPVKSFTLTFDVQKIMYSDVRSIANTTPTTSITDPCTRPIGFAGTCQTPGLTATPRSRALGEDDGFGFGWKDQTVYKVGTSYAWKAWTFRAGYNYAESPIRDDQLLFNMIAPAIIQQHATVGFSYAASKNSEWSFNYVHGFKRTQTCAVDKGCQTMFTQAPGSFVAVELEVRTLGGSFSYYF